MKDYTRDHIKPKDREKCYFDNSDPSELETITKNTTKNNRLSKRNIKIDTRFPLSLMILPATPILHESPNYYISYIPEVVIT